MFHNNDSLVAEDPYGFPGCPARDAVLLDQFGFGGESLARSHAASCDVVAEDIREL